MKIVIISGIFPPDIGGPASYVPKIAAEWVRRGHQVQVVCLSDRLDHDDATYSFPVYRIRRGLFKPYRVFKTAWTAFRLALNADAVYANTLGFESFLAGLFAFKPVIHKVVGDYAWEKARNRGWFPGTIDAYQQAPKSLRLWLLDLHRALPLRHAAAVITPSVYLKNMVAGWGVDPSKITVVYNAVELPASEMPTRPPDAPFTLITVCRLTPWKGVEALIRYTAARPDVHLRVVGDGPLRGALEALAQSTGAAGRVHFYGNVDKRQVYKALQESDLFVLNSTYEGLPHVVLEAMACRTPVLCNDVGGCSEVVHHGDTGILLPSGVPSGALENALDALVANPIQRRQLAANAFQALLTGFTTQKMFDDTEHLLRTASGTV